MSDRDVVSLSSQFKLRVPRFVYRFRSFGGSAFEDKSVSGEDFVSNRLPDVMQLPSVHDANVKFETEVPDAFKGPPRVIGELNNTFGCDLSRRRARSPSTFPEDARLGRVM